ncbi:MAG: hypothetical protein AAFP68_11930 [Pseudomonadota bacterium]
MPVIINDLEIILETPGADGADAAAAPATDPAPEGGAPLTPADHARIGERLRDRARRVQAH